MPRTCSKFSNTKKVLSLCSRSLTQRTFKRYNSGSLLRELIHMISIGISVVTVSMSNPVIAADTISPNTVPPSTSIETQTLGTESTHYYPQNYPLISVNEAENLQTLLNKHQKIRLENADYTAKAPKKLIVKSDQAIFGLPNTILNDIEITSGTQRAILSSLTIDTLLFSTGKKTIRDNTFKRLVGTFKAQGAKLESNTIIDWDGAININSLANGSLNNNHFIKSKLHAKALSIRGNYVANDVPSDEPKNHEPNPAPSGDNTTIHPNSSPPQDSTISQSNATSQGNVFIFLNFMTSHGDTALFKDLEDLTIIGMDLESWNWSGQAKRNAAITVDNLENLTILGLSGGSNINRNLTPLLESNATTMSIVGATVSEGDKHLLDPNIILGKETEKAFLLLSKPYSIKTEDDKTRVYKRVSEQWREQKKNNKTRKQNLSAQSQPIWKKPPLSTPISPTGDNWQSKRNLTIQDDTLEIQNRINNEDYVILEEKVYYISKPLILKSDQGLIGRGMEKTAIVALTPNIDMVKLVLPKGKSSTSKITLADLSLQGGLNGFHFKITGAGLEKVHILTGSHISHVAFRNMSEAGMHFSFPDSHGGHFDNNFLDTLHFINNKTGFKQTTSGKCASHYCSLMDKVLFYNSQFIANQVAVDLDTYRGDNMITWVNCRFAYNSVQAMKLTNNLFPTIVNSIFSHNGGDPTIESNLPLLKLIGSYFEGKPKQAKSLLSPGAVLHRNHINLNITEHLIKGENHQDPQNSSKAYHF